MMNLSLMDPAFLGSLTSYDPDAAVYIAAVEAADGQALEAGVKDAINAFVLGCKTDGIWNAIKASCILAGARTLAGALVPLVGTAPTNFNFVAGDYNRKTGLVGNGSTKYLNSNRNNNADPQNNQHMAVYSSAPPTSGVRMYIGAGGSTGVEGSTHINTEPSNQRVVSRNRRFLPVSIDNLGYLVGLYGLSRAESSKYAYRYGGNFGEHSVSSGTPFNGDIHVFANEAAFLSNARLAFYSIGESLDLALLDARVTALVNALAVAIP